MNANRSFSFLIALAAILVPFTPHRASSAIVDLQFAGGNGAASVDQYTGVSGSGWTTAWSSGFGSSTTAGTASVTNTSEIVTGGSNYLHVTYDTTSGTTSRAARVSRQWDTTALSLTTPVTIDFDFRADTVILNSTQAFLFFGSTTGISTTSAADSWKFSIDGAGIIVFNGTASSSVLATAAQLGTNTGTPALHFSIVIDPVADYFTLAATQLSTGTTFTSGTQALRSGSNPSLSYINFVSNGGTSQTGLGYSIDNITVVPEPTTMSLAALGLAGLIVALRRRQRRRN